jgi:hypothetical protein
MFRPSLRRTLEAIDTQAITLIVPLAGSDLKRSIAQSKASNCRAATHCMRAKWER